LESPATGSATVQVLHEGHVGRDGDDARVSGTAALIMDGDAVIVVDPGMAADRGALLGALTGLGPGPGDVTDVVSADGPEEAPLGTDAAAPKVSRDLLLSFATVLLPGHGAPFRPATHA